MGLDYCSLHNTIDNSIINQKKSNMKKKLYSFLLAVLLASATPFAFADITSNLRVRYTFDQIDSTEAKVPYFADQSGNGLDGIIEGAIPLVSGYGATGSSIMLNDTDKVVRVPANIFEDVTNFTVALWINQETLVKWSRIFDFGSNQDHYMFLATDGDVGDYLRFELDVDYDDVDLVMVKAKRALTTKKWNHVAITGEYTITGEDTLATIKMYINGMLNVTSNEFKIAPYMLGNNLSHPYFGDSQWPDPTPKAQVDDFRFYSRALTETDIEELSGVTPAQKTELTNLVIDEASRTEMDGGTQLPLPLTLGDGAFDVIWSTTDSTVIKKDGTAVAGDIAITDAYLTAAIVPAGKLYPMVEKDFFVSVYPSQDPINDLAWMEFASDSIFTRNDTLFVRDGGQLAFEAFTVGGAKILPIGNEDGIEGIDFFNVYVSDNRATSSANKQFLDLGKQIGDFVFRLRDHTISIYYRRDTTIDHKTWSDQGQQLWAFSNTTNLGGATWWGEQPYGAMYFEPDECNVSILDAATETTGTNALKWGAGKTPLGNTWHNITYTQTKGVGYLLVDGVQVATGTMPAPKEKLIKNSNVAGRTGTWYNRLGGNIKNDRISAKNTMLWGFRFMSFSIAPEECDSYFAITDNIENLDIAMDNTNYNIPAYLALLPAMDDARKTLAIGYLTDIHTQLLADYAQAVADSTSRNPSQATVDSLVKRTAAYKTLSADWIKMGKVLASFDDERALDYPGLADLEAVIAAVKADYDNFIVLTEYFTELDAAVLEYQKSQVAAANKPANYTFMLANPSFEEGTGGKKDPKTSGGPDVKLPKGWTLLYNAKSGTYTKGYIVTNADNPLHLNSDFEMWSGDAKAIYRAQMYQNTVEELPAGWYVVSGAIRGMNGSVGGQHIFAYPLKDSIHYKSDTLEADKPGIAYEGGYGWNLPAYKRMFIKFQLPTAQKVQFGFRTDSAIMKIDDMRLAYYGTSEPALDDVTSYIKNAGFETGARTAELEGFATGTNLTAEAGDVFAPKEWTVLATAKAPANNASINILATGASEGTNAYRLKADTLTNVQLTQTIYAPTSGIYKLSAVVRTDSAQKSDARLFANVGRQTKESIKLMTAVDTLINTGWNVLEMNLRAGITDQIDLGLKSSGDIDVDNFTLVLQPYASRVVGIRDAVSKTSSFNTYAKDGVIYINNLTANDRVSVYDIAGRQISVKNPSQIKVSKGMYVIKINNEVIKQLVK